MITTFSALKTKQMNHGSPFAQIKLNDKSLKIRRMKYFNENDFYLPKWVKNKLKIVI